jgi:multiple sugar transport system ATP-binding protein
VKEFSMATVRFEKAQRWYPGADEPAVPGIDLEIKDGEFMVLVGPSGCGKSTTLRMLAGLEEVNEGKIFIGDRDVTHLSPKDRDIAMVFQNYALYPHMTVADNMAFSLKMAKVPEAERKKRVAEAAKILQLEDYLERKPKALSGGQRQRVAMGRAIVRNPQVFCMDEPLSNLDAKMRVQTRTDIAKLQADLGVTTVYVTHDQVEAMTMGDRVAVMKDGYLQQVDIPLRLYDKPQNLFVAGFIGSPQMNLIQAHPKDGQAQLGDFVVPVDATAAKKLGPEHNNITVGVRPEAWRLVSANEGGLPVDVTVVEELGADGFVYGTCDVEGTPGNIIVRVSSRDSIHKGDTIYVTTDPENVHVFDTDTGERLSE